MRFLLLLAVILAASLGVSWMLGHPGSLTVYWLGYEVKTSFTFFCFAALLAASACFLLYLVIHMIANATDRYGQDRRLRRQQQGITAITKAYAALAVSDTRLAERMNQQAQNYLGRIPLTLLLDAQLARAEGDERRTRLYLEEMLDSKETEFVAMRGLIEHARQKGNISEALRLAERARDNKNKESWTTPTLIDLYGRQGRWQEAIQVIDQALRQRKLTAAEARHFRTVIYTSHAEKLFEGKEYSLAISFARKAVKSMPDFMPALLLHVRASIALDEERDAASIIQKAWKRSPHPLLGEEFLDIHAGDEVKYAETLVALNPDAPESKILLAKAYLAAKRWPQAHTVLSDLLKQEESAEACRLMAKIHQEGFGDSQEANRWLLRAAHANPDPRWTCDVCGHEAKRWLSHCPECQAFDSYYWHANRKFHIEPAALTP